MRTHTDSFICELPLILQADAERALHVRFDAARQVYNACLGEGLKRLDLLRQSKAYQTARELPKGPKGSSQSKARAESFSAANAVVGFREYDLHAYAKQFGHSWLGEHLDAFTIQKIATRAFQAVKEYALGKRGRPRFKGKNQFDSVEGKSNDSGIRWRENRVEWLGLELLAIIPADDLVMAHGLNSRVKYVRLVRRKLNGRNRFYAQLICEGQPYRKAKNTVGQGIVGLDIGPSTIAVVAPDAKVASLEQFCDELKPRQGVIRRLQRKRDRQHRANNPANFNPDGTAKKGAKAWRKSARQRETEAQLAEIQRRQAAHRKGLHGQMLNRVLRMGDTIKLEKLSYRAFQRNFGKSVGMRAPGMFVNHLKRKAESAGAWVNEFPTRTTRLSRVCHNCGTVAPKPLSVRWHICECGVIAQRDLYSAFLASCVEGDQLNAGQAKVLWPGVDSLLQAALSVIEPASGGPVPASFGLRAGAGRSQSRSPVIAGVNAVEAQDGVPFVGSSDGTGELGKDSRIIRTPRL